MRIMKWLLPALGLLLIAGVANAQVPRNLNFQGRLADSGFQPVTGTYSITFSLWTTSAVGTGTSCFSEVLSVPVNSGLFNVLIGSGTGGGISTCDFSVPYYLQIQVSGDATAMSPRLPLTAAPYAFNADKLDGLDADAFLQKNPASGNVTVSGKLGVGMTPVQKVDVLGYVKGTALCIGADCRTSWSPGTVSSISQSTGISLSSNPITNTGTINVNTGTVQKRVTGTCASNQGIQTISSTGAVTCKTIPSLSTTCTYNGSTYGIGQFCRQGGYDYDSYWGYDYYRCTCQSTGSWSCSYVSNTSYLGLC